MSLFTGSESCAELRSSCEAQAGQDLMRCRKEVELRCTGDIAAREAQLAASVAAVPRAAELNDLGTILFYKASPDYAGACTAFERALVVDPGYTIARENYMSCLLRRAMVAETLEARWLLLETVASFAQKLLKLDPTNHRALRALGLAELVLKRYERSVPIFERCLELAPLEPICSHFLGVAFLAIGRCLSAHAKFDIAVHTCKDAPAVCSSARRGARLASLACGDPDPRPGEESEVVFPQARRHYDLGLVYAESGALDRAEAEWATAVETDPRHCPAHFRLALAAYGRSDKSLAVRRCEDYLTCIIGRTNEEPATLWGDGPRKCQEIAFGRPRW
ncbi:MAG: hypothetical protein U1E65_00665 [Myxococcota bacterium]